MGAIKGVVMSVDGQCVRVRTAHRNEYNLQTDKEIKRGEDVWVFFDENSIIKDIMPMRTIADNEIPPPDPEEPEPYYDLEMGMEFWD